MRSESLGPGTMASMARKDLWRLRREVYLQEAKRESNQSQQEKIPISSRGLTICRSTQSASCLRRCSNETQGHS